MTAPKIRPVKVYEHTCQRSTYKFAGKLPTRSMILAPSGRGKTALLQNIILDIHRDCFSRNSIFSPSKDVDMAWRPVKDYLENDMKQNAKKEKYLFDSYQPHELMKLIGTQYKIVEFRKANKMKNFFRY